MDNMDEIEQDVEADPEAEEEEEEDEEGEGDYAAEETSTQDNAQGYYPNSLTRHDPHRALHTQLSASSSSDWNDASKPPGQLGHPPPTTHPRPTLLLTSPSPQPSSATSISAQAASGIVYPPVRPAALTAPVYDIVPTIAAPHSTSINSVTATPDMRWVFSGGADGYIRKYNWVETANGRLMLTVAQRHPFVENVVKAGVLSSYWENEDSQCRLLCFFLFLENWVLGLTEMCS